MPMPSNLITRCLCSLALALSMQLAVAETNGFVVKDIAIEGLQRIEPGTVFVAIPLRVGDFLDVSQTPELIHQIYKLKLFNDVKLKYEEGKLIIEVTERPGIEEIIVTGNQTIGSEEMVQGLESIDVAKGRIYDRATLERLRRDLKQRYYAFGKYAVRIDIRTEAIKNNLVNIYIDIHEGETTRIRTLSIVGNKRIGYDTLTEDFQSGIDHWYDFLFSRGNYSKAVLESDLETLKNIYYDRGFLDFETEDVQVTLTSDKRYIDITVKIKEGQRYRVNEVNISNSALRKNKKLKAELAIKTGQIFARRNAIAANNVLTDYLKDRGYAFAKIDVIPHKNPQAHTVDVTFFVTPNRRTYVRRIEFSGGDNTDDRVFRHELRQLESSPYSQKDIELSRKRLQRLPYVTSVNIEEKPVEGSDQEVDLGFNVEERQSGSFNLGAGYSSDQGAVLNLSVNQDNFLGTGNRVRFAFNNSDYNKTLGLSLFDPYFTIDGISRSWQISYTATDYSQQNTTGSDSDEFAAGISFGIPISEEDTIGTGIRFQNIKLSEESSSTQVRDFIEREGNNFSNLILNFSMAYDTRDRSLFTTSGERISSSFELFVPGSDLSYFKAQYSQRSFIPLNKDKDWIFVLGGNLAYAHAIAGTSEVPFYDRYYAGGTSSVRGYRSNTLGRRDNADRALGGEFRVVGNFSLFFPTEAIYDPKRLRVGLFTDIGNVFDQLGDFSLNELRGSSGLSAQWLTAVGAISVNFAVPYNDDSSDSTEQFQLDLGGSF